MYGTNEGFKSRHDDKVYSYSIDPSTKKIQLSTVQSIVMEMGSSTLQKVETERSYDNLPCLLGLYFDVERDVLIGSVYDFDKQKKHVVKSDPDMLNLKIDSTIGILDSVYFCPLYGVVGVL